MTTGLIGTLAANDTTPGNTSVAGTSYGWEGSHLKQDQTSGDIATIEMGARQYVPLLGRFLSVDPVAGGNDNDYNYPNDPVDGEDLTGMTGGTNPWWNPSLALFWESTGIGAYSSGVSSHYQDFIMGEGGDGEPITYFRGVLDGVDPWEPRVPTDVKLDSDGNVDPAKGGISLNTDPGEIVKYHRTPAAIDAPSIPDALKVQWTKGTHYVVIPAETMTLGEYTRLLHLIRFQ